MSVPRGLGKGNKGGSEVGVEPEFSSSPVLPANVLVIDDDPTVGILIGRSLQSEAETSQVFSVPEAGGLILEGIDLIYLDYQMPFRDGLEVLDEIREMDRDIPVIFLTGFGEPALAEQAIAAGASLFLTKPIGPSKVLESFGQFAPKINSRDRARVGVHSSEVKVPIPTDRTFSAKTDSGQEVIGRVSRFGYRSAHVEFDDDSGLAESARLSEIRFRFGDQLLYAGETRVGIGVRASSSSHEFELVISGGWRAALIPPSGAENGENMDEAGNTAAVMESLIDGQSVHPEFRLAVHDLADVLDSIRSEVSRRSQSREILDQDVGNLALDGEFVAEMSAQFGPVFWEVVKRFEKAAEQLTTPDAKTVAKEFTRRILFPYTLSSPFLSRVVERPIGVPGDFGMLGQILGDPLDGHSIYDRIVNSWILSCGAASAYRYRVDLLHREILKVVQFTGESKRPAKVMSMASGVAYEIQRFIQASPPGAQVDFQMVDFSTVTLEEAARQYAVLGQYPEGVSVSMHQSSVIDLANRSRGFKSGEETEAFEPDDDYDLIYCAGLFDYLSDRLVKKVISYLFGLLRPGGKLVVSNFTVENPIRAWMTFVMDWDLIYRVDTDFAEIARNATQEVGDIEIETDKDGVEVYALMKR